MGGPQKALGGLQGVLGRSWEGPGGSREVLRGSGGYGFNRWGSASLPASQPASQPASLPASSEKLGESWGRAGGEAAREKPREEQIEERKHTKYNRTQKLGNIFTAMLFL